MVGDVAAVLTTRATRNGAEDTYAIAPYVIQDATRSRAFHATQDPIYGHVPPALATEPGCVGVLTFDEVQITHRENRTNPIPDGPAPTLPKSSGGRVTAISRAMRPRRLTPREWERLQGFPDDYTAIDYKGRPAKDGPRYEAIGNSMAVPVMRWIGERIAFVDPIVDFG